MTLVLIAVLHLHHLEEVSQSCVNRFVADAVGEDGTLSGRKRTVHLSGAGRRELLRILDDRRLQRRAGGDKINFIFSDFAINWVKTKSEAKLIIFIVKRENSAEKDASRTRSEEKENRETKSATRRDESKEK